MSNVVAFSSLEAEEPAPALPHRRLLLLSRGLAILFTLFMVASVLWLAGALVVIVFFANHVLVGAAGANLEFPRPATPVHGMVLFSSQPFITRVAGFVDIVVAMTPVVFVCWHLRGLFALYARGIVFARQNAVHLKRVGLWLVIYPFAKFAANMLFQLAGGTDKAWAQMLFFDAFVLGVIVYAIAQVMEFGREIEQEKDSFI
jgi:hypothetical protein